MSTPDFGDLTPSPSPPPAPPVQGIAGARPTLGFLFAHPAHMVALGFGSGLSPVAPGTAGTLWAWAFFLVLQTWLDDTGWAIVIGLSFVVGIWACAVTARHMGRPDPGSIVWDEVIAFWLVLWLVMPTGIVGQAIAFGLFRFFDAVKRGPVGWADRRFKLRPGRTIGWPQGLGIIFDDLVAALLTLLVIAFWKAWW